MKKKKIHLKLQLWLWDTLHFKKEKKYFRRGSEEVISMDDFVNKIEAQTQYCKRGGSIL